MTDCPNAEIRDLLPEFLNGTLPAERRAVVQAHLATCTDCQAEIEVLRLVRDAWTEVAAPVKVGAIVAALPRPKRQPVIRPWRHRQAFQIAAAVSFVAVGGISLAVARSFFTGDQTVVVSDTTRPVDSVVGSTDVAPAISFAGGVSDLEDEDLEALLSALESIEALPVTEPAELPLSGAGRQGS